MTSKMKCVCSMKMNFVVPIVISVLWGLSCWRITLAGSVVQRDAISVRKISAKSADLECIETAPMLALLVQNPVRLVLMGRLVKYALMATLKKSYQWTKAWRTQSLLILAPFAIKTARPVLSKLTDAYLATRVTE